MSGVACDTTGKFGPFRNQMFVGDQTFSTVMRCYLEKVNGRYQGACFNFRSGIGSGTLPIEFTPDGSMFVGGTNRALLGLAGEQAVQHRADRLDRQGPLRSRRCGPSRTASSSSSRNRSIRRPRALPLYKLQTYTYIFQASYGSPEVDHTEPTIEKGDSRRRWKERDAQGERADGRARPHELHSEGSPLEGEALPLLHPEAYYTMMQ